MATTRTIRIFLASSITELKEERTQISTYFAGNDVRNMFRFDNVDVQLIRSEDLYSGNKGEDRQIVLNRELQDCDISLFLFKTKIGPRTFDEFETAKQVKGQEIYIYCKDLPDEYRKGNLKKFLRRLDEEGPDWKAFTHVGEVEAQIIVGLLKYERELLINLGERYEDSKETRKFRTALERIEKNGEEHFGKYKWHAERLSELQVGVHRDIEDLMSKIGTIIDDASEPIATQIYKTVNLYKKVDCWAVKTNYHKENYCKLLLDYADFLYKYGQYWDAETIYLRQIRLNEELYGKEHETTANSYDKIGMVYQVQGDYHKALEYYNRALAIRETVLGTDHPDTAQSYNCIGLVVYYEQDNYPKALEYFFKALAIRECALGSNHPDTAYCYHNIGFAYHHKGDYPKAMEYYGKALIIREKILGTEHPVTAQSYNSIGGVYYHINDYPKALKYYGKAIAIRENFLGTDHPDIASSYHNIGTLYYKMGEYSKALKSLEKAFQINKAKLGENHPNTQDTKKWIDDIIRKL